MCSRDTQMPMTFDTSVWIGEGRFMLRPIETVEDALDFLIHYRGNRDTLVYRHAVFSAEDALEGRVPVANAKAAFVNFAADHGLSVDRAAA